MVTHMDLTYVTNHEEVLLYKNYVHLCEADLNTVSKRFAVSCLHACDVVEDYLKNLTKPLPTQEKWEIWSNRPFVTFDDCSCRDQALACFEYLKEHAKKWEQMCLKMPTKSVFMIASKYPILANSCLGNVDTTRTHCRNQERCQCHQ